MAVDYGDIGRRIRSQRKKQAMSQEMLAEMTELSSVHISHIEGGKRMSIETLVNVANALNGSADELLSGSLVITKPTESSNEITLLSDCSQEEQNIILECMSHLKMIMKKYRIKKQQT